ncbi:LOW QUALITY PROTEIN: Hypothetical protein PHPALM_2728, partial [Phytophthora palmivora]
MTHFPTKSPNTISTVDFRSRRSEDPKLWISCQENLGDIGNTMPQENGSDKPRSPINNERGILLLDTGAEVSIVDTAFARKVGQSWTAPQTLSVLVYPSKFYKLLNFRFFRAAAGSRLDLAYGSIGLPDERHGRLVTVGEHIQIEIGQSVELQLHLRMSDHEKFWVTRGDRWVPTVVKGLGKRRYLQITNVSDKAIILQEDVRVGIWLAGDHIPRMPGFVSVGSRRYMEWQNLALEATVDGRSEHDEILMESAEPMVDRPSYPLPRGILKRPEISQIQVKPVLTTEDQPSARIDPQDRTPIRPVGTEVTSQSMDQVKADDLDPVIGGSAERDLPGQLSASIQEASPENRNNSPDPE